MKTVHVVGEPRPPSKRPRLVWVITVLYGLSAAVALMGVAWLLSGRVPMTAEAASYVSGLTAVDVTMSVVLALLRLAAVITLFLLKTAAIKFFTANLVIGLADQVREAISTDWLGVVFSTPWMLLGSLADVGLMVFLVYYSVRLEKARILT